MKRNQVKSVTVLFNKPDAGDDQPWAKEADLDTLDSAVEIQKVLGQAGYVTDILGVSRDDVWKIRSIKSDMVFNLIEWTGEATKYAVKAFRELVGLGIPYTGSDVAGYLLSVDKLKMKRTMKRLGIPTPKWQVFYPGKKISRALDYPVILKPAYEHCGVGISQDSVLESNEQLSRKVVEMTREFNQPILAEEYIEGREVNVTILEENGRPWVLPPIEVVLGHAENERPLFTYDRKWNDKSPEFWQTSVRVADFDKQTTGEINRLSKIAYAGLGGRDYPRLDMRIRGKEIFVLEINNNPEIDFTFQGGIRAAAVAVGLDYGKLLTHIVENTYERFVRGNYAAI